MGEKVDFFIKYNIHLDFKEFFTEEYITKIENFLDNLEGEKIEFVPKREDIFKVFNVSISSIHILIMGMDPYRQKNVATGLAFEVLYDNWDHKEINSSLKNILKLLYYSYENKIKNIDYIRDDINQNKFLINKPDKLFKLWKESGVFLINSALTTILNKSGSHLQFWNEIIENLITYISTKNPNIIYFLWGKNAQNFEKQIKFGTIYKSNHPAICGNLSNKNDFMNSKCFFHTKDLINWRGL
ncbi:MAG: uracil-DNA glycosylase [Fusobacteria bacterium]|nr:uracil-DNA glycosylase [Fusobacteriota bacterium]